MATYLKSLCLIVNETLGYIQVISQDFIQPAWEAEAITGLSGLGNLTASLWREEGAGSTFSDLTILLESCMIMGTIWHINRKHGIFPPPFRPGDSRAITDMLQVYPNELCPWREDFAFYQGVVSQGQPRFPHKRYPAACVAGCISNALTTSEGKKETSHSEAQLNNFPSRMSWRLAPLSPFWDQPELGDSFSEKREMLFVLPHEAADLEVPTVSHSCPVSETLKCVWN